MDWDSTRIVFTKRTLIEFLRYVADVVLPNLATKYRLGIPEPPSTPTSRTFPSCPVRKFTPSLTLAFDFAFSQDTQLSERSLARSPPHLLKPLQRQPTQVRAPASLVKRIAYPNLAVIPFSEAAGTAASFRPTRRVRDAPADQLTTSSGTPSMTTRSPVHLLAPAKLSPLSNRPRGAVAPLRLGLRTLPLLCLLGRTLHLKRGWELC